MGNPIDHAEYLSGALTVTRKAVRQIMDLVEYMPECGFVADLLWDGRCDVTIDQLLDENKLRTPCWYGEGSAYPVHVGQWQRALALCDGDADILIIYESGKRRGSKVIECQVKVSLVDPGEAL